MLWLGFGLCGALCKLGPAAPLNSLTCCFLISNTNNALTSYVVKEINCNNEFKAVTLCQSDSECLIHDN